jgi:hypothetical protein
MFLARSSSYSLKASTFSFLTTSCPSSSENKSDSSSSPSSSSSSWSSWTSWSKVVLPLT